MSKFGELIDGSAPLLLVFFKELEELTDEFHPTLRDVAAAVGDQGCCRSRWRSGESNQN